MFESSDNRVGLQLKAGAVGDVTWILYSGYPAAGDFAIRESGVANHVIVKKTTGSVGIGTTAPGSLLRVEGSNATAYDGAAAQDGDGVTLSIWNQDQTALGSYAALQLVNKGTGSHGKARIACIAPANNQGALAFTVESAGTFKEAMRILGDGKVGIGVAAPTQILHVAGNMRLTGGFYDKNNSLGSAGQILTTDGSETYWSAAGSGTISGSGTDNYVPRFNGTTALQNSSIYANDSGSVGIGLDLSVTSSPVSPLHVQQYASGNYTGEVRVGGSNTDHGILMSYTQLSATEGSIHVAPGYANSSAALKLRCSTNNTNQLVLKGDGKIGIGTAAPDTLLNLQATAGADMLLLRTTGDTSSNLGVISFGNADVDKYLAQIKAVQDGATDSARLEFQTEVAGGAKATRMTIKSDGNVGIGTTSPDTVLTVHKIS